MTVNRAAELNTLPGVGCSAWLGHVGRMTQILCCCASLVERVASFAAQVKVERDMQVNVDADYLIPLLLLLIPRRRTPCQRQQLLASHKLVNAQPEVLSIVRIQSVEQ